MPKERLKWMAAWMAMALVVFGAIRYVPEIVTVSTSIDGKELPIYCVDTEKKQVALSFDVIQGNTGIQEILEILAGHGVKATFFVTGEWAKSRPEDVKAVWSAGHDLGNYGDTHKDMAGLDNEGKTAELMGVHEKVKELTGVDMELFRPPYGSYDNAVLRSAEENGYYTIQWSVDSLDWKDYGAKAIEETICNHKNLGNGAIIRMHNGARYTAQALDAVIAALQEQGYELVPVSELIYKEHYHLDQKGQQIKNE